MEEIKLASVKFKSAGKIYYFSTNLKLKKDDRVVVETARGLELEFVFGIVKFNSCH